MCLLVADDVSWICAQPQSSRARKSIKKNFPTNELNIYLYGLSKIIPADDNATIKIGIEFVKNISSFYILGF